MREEERRTNGKLYNPSKLHDSAWIEAKAAMEEFNRCGIRDMAKAGSILKQVFSEYGDHSMIIPPLYYSQGRNIFIGESFFANTGLVILDDGDVRIGAHVYMGPNVSIYTASHPVDSAVRNTGLQCVHGVTIGNNVWIGGSVTINPGVSIGDETIIGAGSVVTKNIPSGVIAAGNPCRVLREISDADREYWEAQHQDYLEDPDVIT